jgi:hypothetical protein
MSSTVLSTSVPFLFADAERRKPEGNGKMADNMEQFVQQVLQMLLAGDDPALAILRSQLEVAKRRPRENTGVGFFIHFDVPQEAPRLPGNPSIKFGDVIAEMEGLQHGAGFVLFIDNGVLAMLEGYTYDEPWPEKVSTYELKYMGGKTRDLTVLRQIPGWPSQLYQS